MKSITITLEMAQRVKDFVAVTQSYEHEVLLKSGKYVVDAKSILGIFSLDLSKPLVVEVYGEEAAAAAALIRKLKKFEA